jgi:hypothetical protein
MVRDGKVLGIIDWESAGFYARFWITLKPTLSAGFFLKSPDRTEKVAWCNPLREMIEKVVLFD